MLVFFRIRPHRVENDVKIEYVQTWSDEGKIVRSPKHLVSRRMAEQWPSFRTPPHEQPEGEKCKLKRVAMNKK